MIAQAVFSKEQSIQHCLNEQSKADLEREKNEVAKNRIILARIVDAIIFLGQQGLPLRGHRELLVDDSVNTGNFIELLKVIHITMSHCNNIWRRLEILKPGMSHVASRDEKDGVLMYRFLAIQRKTT